MSHQRANTTSSLSNTFDTHNNSRYHPVGGMAATSPTSSSFNTPSSSSTSTSAATASNPLSIAIPRQRSFSSSFSLAATSPRTFTGSSIIANPSNGFLSSSVGGNGSTTPFSAAFGPLTSPTSATSPAGPAGSGAAGGGGGVSGSQAVPVLHRRFSSSFNQLNQIVGSGPPPMNSGVGSQTTERGRRTSLFGGTSPPSSAAQYTDPHHKASPPTGAGGLFRKFSTTGRASGHPFDRNDVGPPVSNLGGPQPNTDHQQQQQQNTFAPDHSVAAAGANNNINHINNNTGGHLSAVDKLKPSHQQDKHSRSSSPMRSMILNGQMLD